MKHNAACMVEILFVAANLKNAETISIDELHARLTKYDPEVIDYSCYLLADGKYITAEMVRPPDQPMEVTKIYCCTWKGLDTVIHLNAARTYFDMRGEYKITSETSWFDLLDIAYNVVSLISNNAVIQPDWSVDDTDKVPFCAGGFCTNGEVNQVRMH